LYGGKEVEDVADAVEEPRGGGKESGRAKEEVVVQEEPPAARFESDVGSCEDGEDG